MGGTRLIFRAHTQRIYQTNYRDIQLMRMQYLLILLLKGIHFIAMLISNILYVSFIRMMLIIFRLWLRLRIVCVCVILNHSNAQFSAYQFSKSTNYQSDMYEMVGLFHKCTSLMNVRWILCVFWKTSALRSTNCCGTSGNFR